MHLALLILMALTNIPTVIYDGTFTVDVEAQANEGRTWHNVFRMSDGTLYAHVVETVGGGGTPDEQMVIKSTDEGLTWAQQDGANQTQLESSTPTGSQAFEAVDAVRIGTTLHLFFVNNANQQLSHVAFSTTTDTYGSVTGSGYTPEVAALNTAAIPGSTTRFGVQRTLFAVMQDDGDIRLFWTEFESVSSVNYIRIKTCTFDPGLGTFSSSASLVNSGVAEHDNVAQVLQDAGNGRTHVFTYNTASATTQPTSGNWSIKHVSIDDDGTVNTYSTIATDGSRDDENVVGIPAIISGELLVMYAAGTDSSGLGSLQGGTQTLKLAYATNGANPSFSLETVPATREPYNGHDPVGTSHPGFIVSRAGKTELWFSTEQQNNGVFNSPNFLMKIQRNGAGDYTDERYVRESDGIADYASSYTSTLSGAGPIDDAYDADGLAIVWIDYFAEVGVNPAGFFFVYEPEQDSTSSTNIIGVSY